ncbi:hypothetical protein SB724_21265, partial [Bacillus sp. SIMBA_031]
EGYYQNSNLDPLNNFRGSYNVQYDANTSVANDIPYENIGFPNKQTLINNNLSIDHIRTFNETKVYGYCVPSCNLDTYTQIDT